MTATLANAAAAATSTSTATCAAVVVHYRNADDTLACVGSLREHARAAHIVVVDNASLDGSATALEAAFADASDVVLLRSAHNRGFGDGCNQGIALALARWPQLAHVLLLNPDATLTAGAFDALRTCAAAHPDAGIVGCRIVRPDGSPWFLNGRMPRWTLSGFHCAPPAGAGEFAAGFVTGCCMLLDVGLLRQGLRFDPRYFLYGEDADLCCDVRAHGRSLWITHRATVVHRGGASLPGERALGCQSREQLYWLTRAKVLLARRRLPLLQRWTFYFVAAVLKPLVGLWLAPRARWWRAYWRGLADGWRG